MSDYGAFAGAQMLATQLSIDRFNDDLGRIRADNARALSDAAWRNHYGDLVDRYNRLLADANKYAEVADETVRTQAGTIADLKAANDGLRAEKEQLRSRLVDVEGELAVLRALDKELHPEAYEYQ
jgi:hypothetical protein